MSEARFVAIDSGECRPGCGDAAMIVTDAPQEPSAFDDAACDWCAGDGDPVVCELCGILGAVSADEDGADVVFSDDLPEPLNALSGPQRFALAGGPAWRVL